MGGKTKYKEKNGKKTEKKQYFVMACGNSWL